MDDAVRLEAQLNIIPKVEDLCVYNGIILYSVRFLISYCIIISRGYLNLERARIYIAPSR